MQNQVITDRLDLPDVLAGAVMLTDDELGHVARRIIEGQGLTQQDVARRLGTTQPKVSRALNGRGRGLAARIIAAWTGRQIEGPYFRILPG